MSRTCAGERKRFERVEVVVVAGQVHAAQRLGAADHAEPLAQLGGQRVLEVGRHLRREVARARGAGASR